ncbi:YbaB/EbfC family nucleoid-associated protein [Gordonia sp. VNK21]|uniref:YbaB/EbfC family nucleoid-associated protein n=1 Tax=Gordonia sp. VNK21 TaxID=3382483 RepID=UPI0038D512CB
MTAELDAVLCRARDRLDALQHAREQLAAARETGEGDDGRVQAVVDAGGGLVGLRLAPGAGGGDADRLAQAVLAAAGGAAAAMAVRRTAVLTELQEALGADTADGTSPGPAGPDHIEEWGSR